MVLNNQGLPESVVKTIQSDSEAYAKQFDSDYRNYASDDYEAGATAQALKAIEREKKVIECLNFIVANSMDVHIVEQKAKEALKQYNETI